MDHHRESDHRARKIDEVSGDNQQAADEVKKSKQSDMPYDLARNSCWATTKIQNLPATFDEAAAQKFAASINVSEVKKFGANLALDANMTRVDMKFPSIDNEAALIVVMHALDFGGGWRQALHAYHGKGAWLTVKPGVEAMYADDPTLSTEWLASRTKKDVAKLFNIGYEVDDVKALVLVPFIQQLTDVINELGNSLKKQGFENMESWLVFHMNQARESKSETPAGMLVQELILSFPNTFDDKYLLKNQPVVLYKKAQLVVGELYHRFRNQDEKFNFCDGTKLTAFIDNVIVAVLRKLGVVRCSKELELNIESHNELASGSEEEVSLRAAAMIGVEYVSKLRNEDELSPVELGNYLWGYLGKTPEYRPFTRHATRDTVFY